MSMWRQLFASLQRAWVGRGSARERIPDNLSDEVPLDEIQKVTFFKRDGFSNDMICCDIEGRERGWFFQEEVEGWGNLLRHLERLPNFQRDWYQQVVQPPFATSETVAFTRVDRRFATPLQPITVLVGDPDRDRQQGQDFSRGPGETSFNPAADAPQPRA